MTLLELWQKGVDAVRGATTVAAALQETALAEPDQIIAVGKAATDMARAAHSVFPRTPILIVTKDGHGAGAPAHARVIEAAHPIPDARSLAAGEALLQTVTQMDAKAHLLMLVSGGASSLAEALPDEMSLEALESHTEAMLASGADIHAMNARRKKVSLIKGGKLLCRFRGASVTTLAISDVEGDDLGVIGSGIGATSADPSFAFSAQIIASNQIARQAIADASPSPVLTNDETLYEDVATLAPTIGKQILNAGSGLHILGGEPTVILPDNPGLGGRNMALALNLAREIAGQDGIEVLVAGTDGTDGPTDAAGALITGKTWDDSATDALARADAYPWLESKNALVKTGPTGTNVMDILLAHRN
ncbi:MAG: DUF4147 domain-containing protein [Pseudomonadota bacterium]